MMSHTEKAVASSMIAVYPDHATAERAVRWLHEAGFAFDDVSIVGRDFKETGKPYGFASRADSAKFAAEKGAWFGGLFGVFIGAGFLVLPGLGLVVVAGPILTAVLAAIEGAAAGAALGGLAGALIGWEVPRERAIKYEEQIKGGKFLVLVRSTPEVVARAGACLPPTGRNTSTCTSRAVSWSLNLPGEIFSPRCLKRPDQHRFKLRVFTHRREVCVPAGMIPEPGVFERNPPRLPC